MYTRDSVIGEATRIDPDIAPTPRLLFTADCPISLKFRTEFDRGEAGLLYMFKVKGHRSRSRSQSSRSQRNVMYEQ